MINEQELAERFSQDVDRIIQNPSEEILPAWPAPKEYIQGVALARFMVSANLIDRREHRIWEELRRCLLDKVANRASSRTGGLGDSCELDDDQLDMVAAGTGNEAHGDSFAVFSCGRSASDIKGSICPDCGRPRGLHPGG